MNKTITRSYDSYDRSSGFSIGSDHSNTIAYDPVGRIGSVTGPDSRKYTYSYKQYSGAMVSSMQGSHTTGSNERYNVEVTWNSDRRLIDNVKNLNSGTTTISNYAYQYNALGQRSGMHQSGPSASGNSRNLMQYAYHNTGELDDADAYSGSGFGSLGSNVTGESYDFGYDGIGNRNAVVSQGSSVNYNSNTKNQYTTVPGQTAPQFDSDGNLDEYDGTFDITYDQENRITKIADGLTVLAQFWYDYMGRRVRRVVGSTDELFLYDGWNHIATYTRSTKAIADKYTWGVDLSGGLRGAGGVGGLLSVQDGASHYYYLYDANGNVGQVINTSATTVAKYEYDPFGNLRYNTGSYASTNPYRFSTKYFESFTSSSKTLNIYYYGYRYYDPVTGKWLSRDPIGERGGLNLYGFVGNDGVNRIDRLGLKETLSTHAPTTTEALVTGAQHGAGAATEIGSAFSKMGFTGWFWRRV